MILDNIIVKMKEKMYVYFKDSHGEASAGQLGPIMAQTPEEQGGRYVISWKLLKDNI